MLVRILVNGREVEAEVAPTRPLATFLRDDLGLTGTKVSCGAGECSACTVILDGRPVTSCLVPVAQADGRTLLTIEGLADTTELHPLQEALVNANAVQCGYCIPGMVVTARAVLDRNPDAGPEDVRQMMSGNICRCTGYQKIVEAVLASAREVRSRG